MTTAANAVDPIAALLAAGADAAAGRPLSPEVADWLSGGIRAYLSDGGTLDSALGLRGARGEWPASTRHAYRERNKALRAAAGILHNDCARLAAAVSRFESCTWPRWRHMDAPPARADHLQRALFEAFSAGCPVPSSARQLRRITVENDSSAGFD